MQHDLAQGRAEQQRLLDQANTALLHCAIKAADYLARMPDLDPEGRALTDEFDRAWDAFVTTGIESATWLAEARAQGWE